MAGHNSVFQRLLSFDRIHSSGFIPRPGNDRALGSERAPCKEWSIMTTVDVTVVVLAALVGLIAGFAGARIQDRFRLTKSQSDAKDIISRAE